ncbi:hypothetical protein QBC38DRAFT_352294 [Podospora fimiseda]|uniref:WW domain-containing protein n=1 Tax=Podospora fimiseda TaxID=252190 RepID=A0AAN7BZE0_9PEZI|nr:hypothetical protein QBC38DRAFT_352294 [Podospora fimiseda]
MDQALAEQHRWMVLQHTVIDDDDSWVMLTRDGEIVPIPGEKILHTTRHRVGLELSTPRELNISDPFYIKNDNGIVYITNERVRLLKVPHRFLPFPRIFHLFAIPFPLLRGRLVIYLPVRPSENFKSFFAPALNFADTHVSSSWLGPWCWSGTVRPVPGGGIPMHIPRIQVKFFFREGGHSEFQGKYEWLKERLLQAQEMGLRPGQNLEPPPPYEDNASGASSGSSGNPPAAAGETQQQQEQQQEEQPQPVQQTPVEPPPDYVEAQAQAISVQYEQRVREEAERH